MEFKDKIKCARETINMSQKICWRNWCCLIITESLGTLYANDNICV